MVAADYAWVTETNALGPDFCLTFVRGPGPDEVIARLGGADPVSIVSAGVALGGSEAVRERVDASGAAHPSGLCYLAATRAGDWTMIIEPNGFLCTRDAAVRALSSAGEMVSFYYNENTTPRVSWAIDGREVVGLDPGYPQQRTGGDPGRLDRVLAELGFTLDAGTDAFDAEFRQRALALLERVTGVHWDADFLARATFRCAGVAGAGSAVATESWYAEVREELAAFAADPHEWADHDGDRWGERGVTDRRVKALGPAGTRLFEQDRELAMAIAYAPADLVARMTEWAWERPFRLAGILDEPWFRPIRDLVRRGEAVPPADVRLVEERMDPYLRTALPARKRDDRGQRNNAARVLILQGDSPGPAAALCWMFAKAEGAGAGTWTEMFVDLRHDFPELGDVVIPPPPPPPVERAAVRRKREARRRQEEQWRRAELARRWGGRIPADERLLEPEVQMYAVSLVPHDRDLVDRIAEAGAPGQRQMAAWAARYCCTRSGMIANDWVEAGVTALERGDPPPPWFTDFDAAFARWQNVPRESVSHSATVSVGKRKPARRIDPAIIAMHTVVLARHDNPLIAAMGTVHSAVRLDDPSTALTAFRAAFDPA